MIHISRRTMPIAIESAYQNWQPKAHHILHTLQEGTHPYLESTGWWDWPKAKGFDLVQEIEAKVHALPVYYDSVIVVGIGGSYLGTRAVVDGLSPLYPEHHQGKPSPHKPVLYAGHNWSTVELLEVLNVIREKNPIVNVISKSGSTSETMAAFQWIRQVMEERFGAEACQHRIWVTTDASKGPLKAQADHFGYPTFPIPDDIGGRFSVLTAVGLVPLCLAGYSIQSLMQGAHDMFTHIKTHPTAVAEYAAYRRAAWESGLRMEVLAYADPRVRTFVEWWKQLFGESEGKGNLGLFPAGVQFPTDLHSLGQYLQEGCPTFLETFFHVETEGSNFTTLQVPGFPAVTHGNLQKLCGRSFSELNDMAWRATYQAHSERGVSCWELGLSRWDEAGLGGAFAFFETVCAVSAMLLEVNPFDQPGVEAYKQKMFAML
jgi:glucose-6-phosphate isomerase